MIYLSYLADYNASKAAVISLHESLRYELDNRCGAPLNSNVLSHLKCSYKCPQIRTTLLCPGHIMTPMFSSITFPPVPSLKFLLPSVQAVTVVKSIITALDESQSQIIMTPFWTNSAPLMRHLPSFLRDLAQNVSVQITCASYD